MHVFKKQTVRKWVEMYNIYISEPTPVDSGAIIWSDTELEPYQDNFDKICKWTMASGSFKKPRVKIKKSID